MFENRENSAAPAASKRRQAKGRSEAGSLICTQLSSLTTKKWLAPVPKNNIYIIELNPKPAPDRADEVAQSALKAKILYPQLIQRILMRVCQPSE